MKLIAFLAAHGPEVLSLTLEHLTLVGIAIALAVLIGVPLGIVLAKVPRLAKPMLGVANIAQTVPSLALFGFLIPLNVSLLGIRLLGGIGPGTAIAALMLYALLPILRGTFTGIRGVDPAVREAGKAMGMTPAQLLFRVELPLAMGVIIAGVRVAAVITVGTATIAAAIDAGGLGKYIFRGLRMNDDTLILAGAVPAALIAVAVDLLLGAVERAFSAGRAPSRTARGVMAAVAAIAFFLAVWHPGAGSDRIVIGSKDFTEQVLLGEAVAQTLEREAHRPVARRFDLGGNLAHQALLAGEIDCYVEYTGTALTAILSDPVMSDSRAVYEKVRREYGDRFGLDVGRPLGFNNTFAILVRGEDARKFALKTISDASRQAPNWQAGFGHDFMARPDGYAGFAKTYGLAFSGAPREMDLSLTYRALRDGQVDLIAGNSTDGLIDRYGLTQLEDDRHYFPPYDAVPIVRREAIARHPELSRALGRLTGVLTVAAMRRLNDEVDGLHRDPHDVVRRFLDSVLKPGATGSAAR